ncbi:MAG TPA: N-acetyltransferase [Thermoplasmata archaeon]|nr:N-acetyltransferase [Thermoplasmata archaeon]
MAAPGRFQLVDLAGDARERAVPILIDSFEGIYRWHAKRTLHRIPEVRGALDGSELAGISMLERLVPEVGYVYYLAVAPRYRHRGVGGILLDDAIARFRSAGAEVVYGAVEVDNTPSLRLFRSRGFREVERKERGYRDGGLGAWGLRSRMMLVSGEVLYGRRYPGPERPPAPPAAGSPR